MYISEKKKDVSCDEKQKELIMKGRKEGRRGGRTRDEFVYLHALHGRHLSVKLAVNNSRAELLRNSEFNHIVVLGLARDKNVDGRGLAGVNLGGVFASDSSSRKVELSTSALIDVDARSLANDLTLDRVAVDDLKHRHDIINDNTNLGAAIDGDTVDLTLDGDGAVLAVADVDHIVETSLIDDDVALGVVLHHPLVADVGLGRRLDLLGSSTGSRTLSSRLLLDIAGNKAGTLAGRTILGLLLSSDVLQAAGDASALVDSTKEGTHVRSGLGRGSRSGGSCRRSSRGGGGSRSSTTSRSSAKLGLEVTSTREEKTGGVELLHVLLMSTEVGDKVLSPLPLPLLVSAVLEVAHDTIEVELCAGDDIVEIGNGLGSNDNPGKGLCSLRDTSDLLNLLSTEVLVLVFTDLADLLEERSSSLLNGGRDISGLLATSSSADELLEELVSLKEISHLLLDDRADLLTLFNEGHELLVEELLELLFCRALIAVTSGGSTASRSGRNTACNALLKSVHASHELLNGSSKIGQCSLHLFTMCFES